MGLVWIEVAALGALAVAAWGVRAWLGRPGGVGAGRLKMADRLAIDARRAVCVVEVDGRRFLVGVGQDAMTLLAELDRKTASVEARLSVVSEEAA